MLCSASWLSVFAVGSLSSPCWQVARAAIGLVCFGSYPLNHHPARLAWEDLFTSAADVQVSGWPSAMLTTAFVASTVATAMVVTDLGSILHIVGGLAASFLVFTLPGMPVGAVGWWG